MDYFAKFTKEADGYSVEFPELPGCVSEGGFHAIPVDARLTVAINIRISRGRRSMAEIAESIGASTQNYSTGKRLEISFV